MTQGAKIGLVATIGTGVVGGGLGTFFALKKPNSLTPVVSIQQQIENSGRTILDVGKSDHWNIKTTVYKTELQSITNLTTKDVGGLRGWCTTVLKGDFKNENNNDYTNARKLCTVPTNKEKLLSESKELAGENDWDGKASAYNSSAAGDNLISSINKTSANKTNLKEWCETIFEKEIVATGNIYTAAKQWCTKGQ